MRGGVLAIILAGTLAGLACEGPLELFPGPCSSEHGRWDEEWDYWSYRYHYDDLDRLALQDLINGLGGDQWIDYIYDDAGLLVREKTYRDDWLWSFVTHAYDAYDRLVETGEYGESVWICKTLTYFQYNDAGQLQHEEYHWFRIIDEMTKLTETSYEYDELGRLAVMRVFGDSTEGYGDYEDDDGMDNVYIYEYDADDVITYIFVDRDNDGSVDHHWQHSYDGHGFLKEVVIVELDDDEVIQRDEYDYDRVGNLRRHDKIGRYDEADSFEKYTYDCWR